MRVYVTHCDTGFLSRALVMAESLHAYDEKALTVLVCHDGKTAALSERWISNRFSVVELAQVKTMFPELTKIESQRSRLEFIYALSPFVVAYLFDMESVSSVTYLDADLHFYDRIGDLTEQGQNYDAAVVGHRFAPNMRHLEIHGKFNVGLVQFNKTSGGRDILQYWMKSCLASTSTTVTSEIFGDQKYLDNFSDYGNVKVFEGHGVNVAPWNCNQIEISEEGKINLINNDPLYFFHFSGLKIFRFFSILSFSYYEWKPSAILKKHMYIPYIFKILQMELRLFGLPQFDKRKISIRQFFRFILYRDILFKWTR
jgi:hypothetical protein